MYALRMSVIDEEATYLLTYLWRVSVRIGLGSV